MKDVPSKITGDQYSANEFDSGINEESKNFVESGDQVLAEGDQFQMAKTAANYSSVGDFFVDSGAADVYVLSAISPRQNPTKFFNGMRLRFNPTNTNTGASTVNPFGLGVKDLKHHSGRDLVAGELVIGKEVEISYNESAGYFEIKDTLVDNLPLNYLSGLNTALATDPLHDIEIFPGIARDNDNSLNIELVSSLIKQIDANWVAGTNAGGFPSGLSLTADTWYHVFVIAKPDGTSDSGYDSDTAASNLLSDATGYTGYRRVLSVKTDGSSQIIAYYQEALNPDIFYWDVPVQDINATNPGTSPVVATLSVPLDISTYAMLSVYMLSLIAAVLRLYPTTTGSGTTGAQIEAIGFTQNRGQVHVLSDTSSDINYQLSASAAASVVQITTSGWIDSRGK